jgi:transmembrane sensor
VDKRLLDKFLNDKCSNEEVLEIIRQFSSETVPEELKKDFEETWIALGNENLSPKDWSGAIEKLKIKIMLNVSMASRHDGNMRSNLKDKYIPSVTRDRSPILHPNRKKRFGNIAFYLISVLLVVLGFVIWLESPREIPVETKIATITKANPKGQKMTIHLNDGSTVILNSNSSLSFPENFSDSLRQIYLSGEAYFEVAEDKLRPFIVSASDINITVLGTIFNVQAYDHSEEVKVALATGKVQISNISDIVFNELTIGLEPGEKLLVNRKTQQVSKSIFDPDEVFSWKNGVIYLSNATFEEVHKKLGDWYGVEFSIEGNPGPAWDFSARFRNESLRTVMDAIAFAKQFKYELKDKKVFIYFGKN